MFSLIITVQSIRLVAQQACLVKSNQYTNEVETHLGHGEGYRIPSLIWPPPAFNLWLSNYFISLPPHYPPIFPLCFSKQHRGDTSWLPR